MYALELIDVVKSYGSVRAVDGVTLRIRPGEIVGLVGPNGAGKTTTLKLVVGLLKPDRGVVRIYGFDVHRDRVRALRHVGYVPENPVAPMTLTVEEFLRLIASLRGLEPREALERMDYYLEVFKLSGKRRSVLASLSRGMLQKVLVTAALMVEPKLLVMDEPMSGMDPESQHVFKTEVRRLVERGAAALISSHLLDVVERFCTRVVLLKRGRIVFDGSIDEMKQAARSGTLEEAFLRMIGARVE